MSLLSKPNNTYRAVATAAALCFMMALVISGKAYAHKIYVAASHIVWNEKTFTLEVEHSLLWHDVETAITVRSNKRFSFDQGEAISEPLMKEYIADRFILEVDGEHQALEWVGMTFNQDKLNVMFKAKLDTPPSKLLVLDGLMTDVFESHKNKVIIEAYGKKWSYDLTRKKVEVKLDLHG